MRDRFGVDVQAMHGDDGIVLRLPDIELDDLEGVRERVVGRELLDLVTLDPDDVRGLVTEEIGGSALYLLSHLSGGVTGEIHHVDSCYNIISMPRAEALKLIDEAEAAVESPDKRDT